MQCFQKLIIFKLKANFKSQWYKLKLRNFLQHRNIHKYCVVFLCVRITISLSRENCEKQTLFWSLIPSHQILVETKNFNFNLFFRQESMPISGRSVSRPDHSCEVPVRGRRQDPDPVQLRIRQHRKTEASVHRERIMVG